MGWSDACSRRDDIIDEYKVYQQTQVDGENVLMCKRACREDAVIANVRKIEWSDRAIFITTIQGSDTSKYILLAKGEQLACCSGDSLIGPLDHTVFTTTVARLKLPVELKNKKEY